MSEYIGITEALEYRSPALRANPCLAVNLAMLGAGTIAECQDALVQAGISSPDGLSRMPDEDLVLEVNRTRVRFGGSKAWFDVDDAIADSIGQFERSEGAIVTVKLNESMPEDESMHLILLAGYFLVDGEPGDILVGDSLLDGMQRVNRSQFRSRLERTADYVGAIFSSHVGIQRPPLD